MSVGKVAISIGKPARMQTGAQIRVLVVDDDTDGRRLLADFLLQRGFRVYLAVDGLDGLRKARAIRPDLVLMDISMHVCDGLTACTQLKSNPGTWDIPVIFLSASAKPAERVAGLAAGAVDYITKPFDFEEVSLRLAIHLLGNSRGDGDASDGIPLRDDISQADATLLRNAHVIVRANLDKILDIPTLAQAVGASPRKLRRVFQSGLGVAVSDYIREERLREARRLLLETGRDIRSIAAAVGYGNSANFATAFRERFGVAPSVFRRSQGAAS
mgnify:CR=1 FL=1